MSIEIKKVVFQGAEIEYFKYGEGDRTLVVLPGLAVKSVLLYKDMVADALSLFGEGFEVYVFDRRLNLPDSTWWQMRFHSSEKALRSTSSTED